MSGRGRSSLQPFLLDGITLTDERNIGDGSYATVVPLSFRGLKCAGKKLHTIFFENASPQEKEHMIDRFQEECQLLSQVKHPNIVQFLGIHFEDGSDLPILVMEYLHCTLSECVDHYGVLPEQVGMGILDDVATGLCYLHGHQLPIVHRDLSANNVLLSSGMKAKISDLGVAKILNLTPARMSQMTKCPGTLSYMPPEALRERPGYDTKLDCFSFGVMILHVLCGRWPYPSEPTRVDLKNRKKVIGLTEVERRKEYIQKVRGDHPLVELIRDCLDNDHSQRPDAESILRRLRQVISQSPPSCGNKMELLTLRNKQGLPEQLQVECYQLSNEVDGLRALVMTMDEEMRRLSEQLEQSQRKLAHSKERLDLTRSIDVEQVQCRLRELSTEVEGLKVVVRSKETIIQAKEQAIQAKRLAMQAMEEELTAKQKVIESQQQEIASKDALLVERAATIGKCGDQLKKAQSYLLLFPHTSLHWRKCADMPKTLACPQSILIGDVVFVAAYNSHAVLRYDTRNDQWSVLPSCPLERFGLGQHSGNLVAVGGWDGKDDFAGHVYTFDEEAQQWKKSIPPMPTPRILPTVVTYNSNIAVCGGFRGDKVVEFFESEPARWYTAAFLPVACAYKKLTIVNDTCYLGGGGLPYAPNTSIVRASMPSVFKPPARKLALPFLQPQSVWTTLPDTPLYGSALANTGDTLLALGGRESTSSSVARDVVHAYVPSTKAWLTAASLPQACSYATAELLPSGEVMLIGG